MYLPGGLYSSGLGREIQHDETTLTNATNTVKMYKVFIMNCYTLTFPVELRTSLVLFIML